MKKSVLRILCFMLILAVVLSYVNKVFKVKDSDGIYGVTKFYELEEQTVDVLILGSSHAFEDFNTGTLWDAYGMSSFILGGSVQPMWNTYYYLKEALKTQTPKLIVLEGYMTAYNAEFIDDSRIIKNNYGLRWSLDKIASIKISSPEERWNEFLLEYTQYHTRYRELEAGDFLVNQGNRLYDDWKGFGCNMVTTPLESADISGITQRAALYQKTEKYYRAIIELAQEKGIPIAVVISPYAGISEGEQQLYNTAEDIATEYGVPFINCNLLISEIGIDYSTDAADPAHLNYRGNQKYSSYIGAWLKDRFEISVHTDDPKYETWQRDADFIQQMCANQTLVETYDLNVISELMQNPYYRIILSVDDNCSISDANLSLFFDKVGIYGEALTGIWLKEDNKILWHSGTEHAEHFIEDSSHDFCMRRFKNDSEQYINHIIVDNIQYQKVNNGINVLIYDKKTEKIADMFGIDADAGYCIVK